MADKRLSKKRAREETPSDEEEGAPEQQQQQQHAAPAAAPAADAPSGSASRRDDQPPPAATSTEPDVRSSRPRVAFASTCSVGRAVGDYDRAQRPGSWTWGQIAEDNAFTDFEDIGLAEENPTIEREISTLQLRIRCLIAAYNTTRNRRAGTRPRSTRPTPFTPKQRHEVGRIRQMIDHIQFLMRYTLPQTVQQQASASDAENTGSVESDEESDAEQPDSFEDDNL